MKKGKKTKFVRVESTLRKLFDRKITETIKREEVTPSPDSRKEELLSYVHARFPGLSDITGVEVDFKKKSKKTEEWTQHEFINEREHRSEKEQGE